MKQEFVPGLELNARFYADVVAPLIDGYDHAAGLLGWGSDVLRFDDARSMDHGWGPRLQLFVNSRDVEQVRLLLDDGLPEAYAGLPVRYGWDDNPVRHWVDVGTLGEWLTRQLGLDPRDGLEPADWVSLPQQLILGVVRGAVLRRPSWRTRAGLGGTRLVSGRRVVVVGIPAGQDVLAVHQVVRHRVLAAPWRDRADTSAGGSDCCD